MNRPILTEHEAEDIANITRPGMYYIGRHSVEAILRMLDHCRPTPETGERSYSKPPACAECHHRSVGVDGTCTKNVGGMLFPRPCGHKCWFVEKGYTAADKAKQGVGLGELNGYAVARMQGRDYAYKSAGRGQWHFYEDWQPIETAPFGEVILVWVPLNASVFAVYRFSVDGPWKIHTAEKADHLPASWKPTLWTHLPIPSHKDIEKARQMLEREVRECPGCIADHLGYHNQADRHDEQCKAEHADPASAPLGDFDALRKIINLLPSDTEELPGIGTVLTRSGLERINNLRDPAAVHLAAAEAWEDVSRHKREDHSALFSPLFCTTCLSLTKRAQEATGAANTATNAGTRNSSAFGATVSAIMFAMERSPQDAAAAHKRDAKAYQEVSRHA